MRLSRAVLAIALVAMGGMAAWHVVTKTVLAQKAGTKQPAPEPSGLPDLEERKERLKGFQAGSEKDLALPEAVDPASLSKETAQHYQEALRAYYDYRRSGYDHRMRVFEWQLISTKIIFVVVLFLVFSGIYFAAIQFHYGLRHQGPAKDKNQPETTEFIFSLKELKVRSPVLGVIVLSLSLAFFYLYLVYVYPIENVF